jgi:hypothetical protein
VGHSRRSCGRAQGWRSEASNAAFAEHGLPSFGATANLVHTQELGKALAADLGPAWVCLMPQHGLLTAGRDIAHAVMYAVLLERACAVQLTAQAAGPVRHWTDHKESLEKDALAWPPSQIEAGWHNGYGARRGPEQRPLVQRAVSRGHICPTTPRARTSPSPHARWR